MLPNIKFLIQKLDNRMTMRNVGFAFGLLALAVIILGHLFEHHEFNIVVLTNSLWANAGTELASIAITILLIERLIQRRDLELDKARLVRDFRSAIRDIAVRAAEELRAYGWLYDGSLQYIDLSRCNLEGTDLRRVNLSDADLSVANLRHADLSLAVLQGADLSSADLRGAFLQAADLREATLVLADLKEANLSSANLQGAVFLSSNLQKTNLNGANLCGAKLQKVKNLADGQLVTASVLRGALMPDGSRYDGRFNLDGDVIEAVRVGVNTKSPTAMAKYYGVSIEDYYRGQDWARDNSPKP